MKQQERESLKIFEVDIEPFNLPNPDSMQRFCVCARNETEAHFNAITSICYGVPTSTPADWTVKKIYLVKDYKL